MTKKDLSQLYHLSREIELMSIELTRYKSKATSTVSCITGMPPAGNVSDKTSYGADIADLTSFIELKQRQRMHEYKRLLVYISHIDDSLTRQIFMYRYIKGLSWRQVAFRIGGANTEDSVQMLVKRFLKNN